MTRFYVTIRADSTHFEVRPRHTNNNTVMASNPDVFSLLYMRRLRFSLNSIASWPHNVFGGSNYTFITSTMYRCLLIFFVSFNMSSTVVFLQKHVHYDLAHTYFNMMLASVYLQRLFLPFQKKFCIVVKRFVLEFHLIHHKHQSDYAAQIYERVNKICMIASTINLSYVVVVGVFYNLVPLYNNFKAGMFSEQKPENGTFEFSVYYELPFDQNTYHGYSVVFIYNCYVSYNAATGLCMYDLLIFTMLFHIWGHLSILLHDLKSFSRICPQFWKQSPSVWPTQEEMFVRLKDIIRRHQIIKKFMSDTSKAFSITLCYYLLFHQLSGCVLLLKCSSLDPEALGRYGSLTIMTFQQLIATSVIFELVNSKSDFLADHVYDIPWEHMNISNRRIVMVFLHNVQKSLALKAGGMVPVGVLTMSTIIRTSCSYFVMLRTLTE